MSRYDQRPPPVPAGYLHHFGSGEERLARELAPGLLPGAVISAHDLAPHPPGARRAQTHTGDELLGAVRGTRATIVHHPATAALTDMDPRKPGRHGRRRFNTAPAQALRDLLPLRPDHFLLDGMAERLAALVAIGQGADGPLSAPSFRTPDATSPWRAVNRELLAATRDSAAGRPVVGWCEVPVAAVLDGTALELAADFAGADATMLRIAGLRTAAATLAQARAVLALIGALAEQGRRPVLHACSSLGVAALAAGAHAFAGGYPSYQHVPDRVSQGGGPRSPRLKYEEPWTFVEHAVAHAIARGRGGQLETCPEVRCRGPVQDNLSLREHMVHLRVAYGAWASRAGAAEIAATLAQAPHSAARVWAKAIDEQASSATSASHSPS